MKRILLVVVLCLSALYGRAQDDLYVYHTDSSRVILASEVTVVGRKEGRELKDLPVSSTQINSRLLRIATINNIKDFSLTVPNMFMPDYGTKLTSPIYIRGVGSRINSPSVGLYVDGIPYFEKSAFDFEFSDISSIEVLRGPQGTLYGRNTMGGIVNVTTKSPLTYKGTSAFLSGGNKGRVQASLSDYRNITEHFGYGITGYYQHNDGFFYNETLSDFADKLNSGGGRIKLSYKRGRNEFNFVSNVEYSDQSGYPYMLLNTKTLTTDPVNYNRPSFYRRMLNSNGLSYVYTSPKIVLTSRTAHQYSRDHQGIDQDFSPKDVYFINQHEKQNMVTEEIEIKQSGEHRINWIMGVSGFYQSMSTGVVMDYLADAVPANSSTDKSYNTPRYGAAVYGQATVDRLIFDNLSLTVGLRYDFEKADMRFEYYKNAAGQSTLVDDFNSKLTHDQLSPKFSLQYRFKNYGQIYATVTKGYKAGGFNTSFVTEKERSFMPEKSWNYELGTKFSLYEDKLTGSAAVFYIDWNDQQVYQPLSTGKGSLLKNAAKSRSYGVEASLTYQPILGLNIGVDYGYTKAKFIDYVAGPNKDYSLNRLPHVPQSTVSGRVDYTINSVNSVVYDRINVALQYNGVGDIYWNDANSVREDFYNLLNARASISKNIVTLAVWAKNITNTKYNAYYFEALGNSFVQKGRPFTVGVDLMVSF